MFSTVFSPVIKSGSEEENVPDFACLGFERFPQQRRLDRLLQAAQAWNTSCNKTEL